MPIYGFDALSPPALKAIDGRRFRVAAIYVAGPVPSLLLWPPAKVAALAGVGVEGILPIAGPRQDWPWPDVDGELVLRTNQAVLWGVPKGAPLALDVEQGLAEKMGESALNGVLRQWIVRCELAGYVPWVYGSNSTLLLSPPRAHRWLALWPRVTPVMPKCPGALAGWQYRGDDGSGIDLDVFQAGVFMRPDRRGVVLVSDTPAAPAAPAVPVADPSAFLVEGTGYWAVVPQDLSEKVTLPAPGIGEALVASGQYERLNLPAAFVDSIPERGAKAAPAPAVVLPGVVPAAVPGVPAGVAPPFTAAVAVPGVPAGAADAIAQMVASFAANPAALAQFMQLVAAGAVQLPALDDPGAAKPFTPALTAEEAAAEEARKAAEAAG